MTDLYTARCEQARQFVGQGLGRKKAWTELPYAYDIQEDGMLFLVWFDDSTKKTAAQKLAEAQARYVERFGVAANVALVNEADAGAVLDGCEVQVEKRVRPCNYQLGRVEL